MSNLQLPKVTYFDGLLNVTVAKHGNTRYATQYRSKIFEKCTEVRHDFARRNIQRTADSITVLQCLLIGIEGVREKPEAGNFVRHG